jgi:hypothetical protein
MHGLFVPLIRPYYKHCSQLYGLGGRDVSDKHSNLQHYIINYDLERFYDTLAFVCLLWDSTQRVYS